MSWNCFCSIESAISISATTMPCPPTLGSASGSPCGPRIIETDGGAELSIVQTSTVALRHLVDRVLVQRARGDDIEHLAFEGMGRRSDANCIRQVVGKVSPEKPSRYGLARAKHAARLVRR